MEEIPFIATENILMESVKRGGDRQKLHEKIREYSMEASNRIKNEGLNNNLLSLISNDPDFNITPDILERLTEPSQYTGRATTQTQIFLTSLSSLFDKYFSSDIEVELIV